MKLFTLARLVEAKYGLVSEGADPIEKKDPVAEYLAKNPPTPAAAQIPAQIVAQVKSDIMNAYNLYVNSETAKEPVLQMLADAGVEFSKDLVKKFETLISNIKRNAGSIEQLYKVVKEIRQLTKDGKNSKEVREAIHNSVRVTKESEKNYRERVKSKFESVLVRIHSIFDKQVSRLGKFLPDEPTDSDEPLKPQRMELSKEKLSIFMKTPAAQQYGLDNINVMQKILFFGDLRQRVITLINAIDRGHIPADGPEVAKETAEIIAAFRLKEETNVGALEQSRLPNPQLERALIMQKNDEIFEKNKQRELEEKYDPSFVARQHEQTVQKEEMLERNQEMERLEKEKEESPLLNKYNSLSFSDWLKRSSR